MVTDTAVAITLLKEVKVLIATSIDNLILRIFFGLIMVCAAVVIGVAILSLTGLFGLGVQVSGEPIIHREVTRGELVVVLLAAMLMAGISFFILRRIHS